MLAECVTFTLTARIAPEWNRVGSWLLQGKRFLHHAQPINAVKIKVNVANERLEVCVKATKVAFPLITPQDLGVDEETLDWFVKADEYCQLTERDFGHQTLHVLPRLTRAKLVSITKKIPPCESSCIKDWQSMKSYWKNMYGYRLGVHDNDVPTVYYNVNFWNGLSLTYPEWTVRLDDPKVLPRVDPKPIIQTFLKDLVFSNKVVFGMRFSLEEVPLLPTVTGVTPQYSQPQQALCSQVGWPAPAAPLRQVQPGTRLHQPVWRTESLTPSQWENQVSGVKVTGETTLADLTPSQVPAGEKVRGQSTLANLTENQWRGTSSLNTEEHWRRGQDRLKVEKQSNKNFGNKQSLGQTDVRKGFGNGQTEAQDLRRGFGTRQTERREAGDVETPDQVMEYLKKLPCVPPIIAKERRLAREKEQRLAREAKLTGLAVKTETKTRDSGYVTPPSPKKEKAKSNFTSGLNASIARTMKVQAPTSKYVYAPGRMTAKLGDQAGPRGFTEDPKFKAAVARAKVHMNSKEKLSRTLAKKQKEKENKNSIDLDDVMTF